MIREATSSDSIDLAALSIEVWLHTYATDGVRAEISKYVLSTFTEEHFAEILGDSRYRVLLWEGDGHLRGFVVADLESTFEDESNGYEIAKLYVQEHFQGSGIGSSLLGEIAARHGTPFWLATWVHNTRAIDFYQRQGFTDIGRVDFDLEGEMHENRVFLYDGSSG